MIIEQPLSCRSVEIISEAMASDDQQFVFESPVYPGQPIHRTALATALRGTKHEKHPENSKTPGLRELLGLKPFRPHDLRRTAATLAGELGFSEAAIAKCLDHAVTKDDENQSGDDHRLQSVEAHAAEARGARRRRGRVATDHRQASRHRHRTAAGRLTLDG
ncbi:hypothetical protein [Bradyrhizobium sp. NAS96.2]|uniref:hypothetical protein n=1 Tax=Bradyrhizobium sp. NAS96.2 TaxID=1680160 RepID=UPI001AEC862E|nr:hypothetical protein [Bradyrhizobium sp. NAS96.2]